MKFINMLNNRPATLKNKEKNKRIFILANGPSILCEDLTMLKNEIVISMNASFMLADKFEFESQYYVLSDARFLNAPEKRIWATQNIPLNTKRIVRADLREFDDPELEARTFYIPAISRDGFSKNLSSGYYYGCTTTMLALQLAWHLGCREAYLLGCDLRYPEESPRFYAEATPQLEDAFTSVQLSNIVNAAIEFEKQGGRVVNCSARSFLRPYLPFRRFDNIVKFL